jgi:acyl-CoA synthetase (AMP-forming)/AMP-acid ligase II
MSEGLFDQAAGFPFMSIAEANDRLTAPGGPYEVGQETIRGVRTRVWTGIPSTLVTLLEHTQAHGDSTFLVLGEDRVTYSAFRRAVDNLAAHFAELGIRAGDRVAIAMRNLPEWPVAFFAAASVGAIAVPLNAWWTGPELRFALEDSAAILLICDTERYHRLEEMGVRPAELKHVIIARTDQPVTGAGLLSDVIGAVDRWMDLPCVVPPAPAIASDDDAVLLYTSGTSGRPKGAIATHRNVLSCIASMGFLAARAVLRSGGEVVDPTPKVLLLVIPMFHVTGCAANLLPHMWLGSKVVLMNRWNAIDALHLIEREKVTVTGGVPTIPAQLLSEPRRRDFDLSSLEVLTYGGAPAPMDLPARIAGECHCAPGNGWGMTETCATVTGHFGEDYVRRPGSAGPPVPVAELRIVGDSGEVGVGEVGELWVKGPQVVRGYWNRPEANAECFVDGWLRTGDLCRVDEDGFLYLVDRIKDIVIRGGENIYTVEVEAVLLDHPLVTDAAVIGIPHLTLGEEPVAAVQLASDVAMSENELKQWVRDRLAAFKTPVEILFVHEPLPRNANGKIMKDVVRSWFANFHDITS